MAPSDYLLPNSPALTSVDPLGLCSVSEDEINHFILVKEILQDLTMQNSVLPPIYHGASGDTATRICSKISDMAYSLHGDSSMDTDGLKGLLIELGEDSREKLQQFVLGLVSAALTLDDHFPGGTLSRLKSEQSPVNLDAAETDCLLAHLFLGTLQMLKGNEWGRPGFTQLFSAATVNWATVRGYVTTLVEHFAKGGYSALAMNQKFRFTLSNARSMPDITKSQQPIVKNFVRVVDEPFEPSSARPEQAGLWPEYVLVAAHSQPGPGPSGTQEERLVGQSPALAIVSLLKPVLGPDEVVITSPFPVHASWKGHGRQARMIEQYSGPEERPTRCYIVADALELDVESCEEGQIADLRPGNVEREVRKLFAAFDGAKHVSSKHTSNSCIKDEDIRIQMPPWGCGAFGGSLEVKAQCMMMAAALAGLNEQNMELTITPDRASELQNLPEEPMTVAEAYERLKMC
jgi:hypothetical protein